MTKKEKKSMARLAIQKKRIDSLEDSLLEATENGLEPYIFPVAHHFAEGVYCREVFVHKGHIVTGVVHKISSHFVLVQGAMRFVWGDSHKDVVAPALCRNEPGQKNAVYAIEDCLIYQFTPNPGNSTDLREVYGFVTDTPGEVQGMDGNRQLLAQRKGIENAA